MFVSKVAVSRVRKKQREDGEGGRGARQTPHGVDASVDRPAYGIRGSGPGGPRRVRGSAVCSELGFGVDAWGGVFDSHKSQHLFCCGTSTLAPSSLGGRLKMS